MKKLFIGSAWVFGDNIDTDIIAPPDTIMGAPGEEEENVLRKNAFRPIRENFWQSVKPGDILIAGKNFGFGSHREQANVAIRVLGFSCMIAETFARIYFRNSIAFGFPAFEVPGVAALVKEGDTVKVDTENWIVINETSRKSLPIPPQNGMVRSMLEAGGIFALMHRRLNQV
jgi:3-isopropylmalate/(R)-2-methylmalate dehydratase small subunit